jgi:hypothetical protein
MRRATVRYAGRRVRARRVRGRLRATIDLRRNRAGRYVVRVTGRTRSGRVVRQTRVYRTCARRRSPSGR